jgi:hypothetical protein
MRIRSGTRRPSGPTVTGWGRSTPSWQPCEPHDHRYELLKALGFGATVDPELLRLSVRHALLLSTLDEIIEQVGADRLQAVGGGWREAPLAGPDRNELVKVVAA